VEVSEWEAGEVFTRAGAMTTVYPDELAQARWDALRR
jgi:hypothetical protein